jgi:hypothetical protein
LFGLITIGRAARGALKELVAVEQIRGGLGFDR